MIMTHQNTKAGTLGGTCIAVVANITHEDIVKTILLAALGAIVSFLVSMGLRSLIRWIKSRKH
jgi:mannitol-specific phosphotransferase system IIBC component